MPGDLLSTREVAEYLDIHEKQVYALIKARRIPATKVTGKWLFPKKLVDRWLEESAQGGMAEARRKSRRVEGAFLAAGSNDPILDLLQSHLRRTHPDFYLFGAATGSAAGLKALDRGHTDIAWSHLYHPDTGEYTLPYLPRYVTSFEPVAVTVFSRELGFVVRRGNPRGLAGFADLARPEVTIVNRQEGAGTRLLLDQRLGDLGIPSDAVRGYRREAVTHLEVGLAVLSGEADTGLASSSVANILNLEFIPVTWERFDMVLSRETFFGPGAQAILETLRSGEFRRRVSHLGAYDFEQTGEIVRPH
jgi:excisionase family DNA binding protein